MKLDHYLLRLTLQYLMFQSVVGEEVLLVQAEGGQQVAEEPQLLGHGVGLLAPVSHLGWPENGGSVITIPYYKANMFCFNRW